MPARSIGTATISFGLVSVPVNVYSSAESQRTCRSTCCTRSAARG